MQHQEELQEQHLPASRAVLTQSSMPNGMRLDAWLTAIEITKHDVVKRLSFCICYLQYKGLQASNAVWSDSSVRGGSMDPRQQQGAHHRLGLWPLHMTAQGLRGRPQQHTMTRWRYSLPTLPRHARKPVCSDSRGTCWSSSRLMPTVCYTDHIYLWIYYT